MNIEMMEKVADAIPQYGWFSMSNFSCCIAAVACMVADGKIPEHWWKAEERAQDILGMDGKNVFYVASWPEKFVHEYLTAVYNHSEISRQVAQVAVDRLRHMVATGE